MWPSRELRWDAASAGMMLRDVRCFCLGLSLPTLVEGGYVDRSLPDVRVRRRCDALGHQLGCATLPGGDQAREWHDMLPLMVTSVLKLKSEASEA